MSEQCETPALARFGTLRERIQQVVHDLLRRCLDPTKDMIRNIISCELAYVNTNHPDFIGGSQAVSETMDYIESSKGGQHGSNGPSNPGAKHHPPPSGNNYAECARWCSNHLSYSTGAEAGQHVQLFQEREDHCDA